MSFFRELSETGKNVWYTKDGTAMTFSEMSDSHLRNCAAMLKRRLVPMDALKQRLSILQDGEEILILELAIDALADKNSELEAIIAEIERYLHLRDRVRVGQWKPKVNSAA